MTRIVGPTGSRRRRRFLVAPVLLTMMVGLMFIGGAQAVHDVGLFELDANVHDQAAVGDDWSNIFADTDGAFTDTGIVADPAPRSIFTGGGSKDDLDIPQWKHKDGSVPDKDDITDAYAAAYTLGGDTYAYFGLDRFAVQGSANVGFWFFQGDVAPIPGDPVGSTSTFSGQHEVGDLLVLSEFDQGGGGVSIKVFEWVGTGGDEGGGTLQTLFGGATGLPADCDTVGAGDDVCANVNTSPILDADIPWNYVGKGGTRDMPTAAFFEGGINLDAFFGEAPCFTNVVAETRSSFEVNAVLKDFVHSQFELCSANISIAPDDVNDVGDTHTFTVTVNKLIAGQETPADDGTIVTVTLTDQNGNPITPITDTCATGTIGGTCSLTFTSDVAGVVTGHAEADVAVGDTTFHVETGPGVGQNPDAKKRFVDARISITPDDVNGIGETHTFVVDVDKDLGAGFVAADDGHVDFTLTDAGGASSVVDTAASSCDDAGDNLDANGQCTIVFTSDTVGTVTGHASVTLLITTTEGTVTLTRETDGSPGNTDDAVKRFVNAKIAIAPDDVNSIGETHTFVVDVEKDLADGAGFVAATEGDVDFTLSDAGGASSVVDAAASSCDDPGDNLDANGQCTIVFTSETAGTVTGHASVTLVITTSEGTVTLTRATDGTGDNSDDAVKEFVDGSLAWFKNDDTGARLGGATFEVCRTHNLDSSTDPDSFVDIPDVCVSVLDNSPPDADPDVGEFLLVDLILGRYTVDEIAPFPPGFEPDPDVVTVELTLATPDVTITEPFVNRGLFRLIVITCNTSTEALVDGTVDLAGDVRETINPSQLPAGLTEETLCTLPGANYDNLSRGIYTPSVELPDLPPLFP